MDADQNICLCFHVSRRKIIKFIRLERPQKPSQISECGGAGTGCGWCRPFLKRLFEEHQNAKNSGHSSTGKPEPSTELGLDLQNLTPEAYAQFRKDFISQKKDQKSDQE